MTTHQPLWADESLPYAAVTFAGCRKAGKAATLAVCFELPSTAVALFSQTFPTAHDCPLAVALLDFSVSPVFCFLAPAGAGGQGLLEGPRALPPNPVACELPLPKPMLTVPLLPPPKAAGRSVPVTGPPLIKSSKERFCEVTGFDEVVAPAPMHTKHI